MSHISKSCYRPQKEHSPPLSFLKAADIKGKEVAVINDDETSTLIKSPLVLNINPKQKDPEQLQLYTCVQQLGAPGYKLHLF
jgi:hypothetical protein